MEISFGSVAITNRKSSHLYCQFRRGTTAGAMISCHLSFLSCWPDCTCKSVLGALAKSGNWQLATGNRAARLLHFIIWCLLNSSTSVRIRTVLSPNLKRSISQLLVPRTRRRHSSHSFLRGRYAQGAASKVAIKGPKSPLAGRVVHFPFKTVSRCLPPKPPGCRMASSLSALTLCALLHCNSTVVAGACLNVSRPICRTTQGGSMLHQRNLNTSM